MNQCNGRVNNNKKNKSLVKTSCASSQLGKLQLGQVTARKPGWNLPWERLEEKEGEKRNRLRTQGAVLEEQAWGGPLGIWRPDGAHRRSRGSEHNSSTPGLAPGAGNGSPEEGVPEEQVHCGQSSPTGLAVPGEASQAPFEGNLKQDPDAVEHGWEMKGVSSGPVRAQAPVSVEAPPLGEGAPRA